MHGASGIPLLGQTIGDNFDAVVARFPEREALISARQGLRYTYAELHAQVDLCARGLLSLGLEPGDRVGIWAANCSEWTITQLATAKIGAILVNINPAYRSAELDYVLRHSGIRTLVMFARGKSGDYVRLLSELAPELEQRRPRPDGLWVEAFPLLQQVVVLDDEVRPGCWNWSDLLELAELTRPVSLEVRQLTLHFDDPINIQYTSGTTGSPKGATLSHHNILNNAYFVGQRMRFTKQDRLCIPVPLYHCFGMVMGNLTCVSHGAAMVYPSPTFEPLATLQTIAEERCTAVHGVPTMFIAQLHHPEFDRFDLSSLRTGIMAGAPCPIEVMRQVLTRMHVSQIEIAYGMTETSPVSFQSEVDDPLEQRVATVGRVMPHLECKIVDPGTGHVLPRGKPGELCTRGYSVMRGYWGEPDATSAAIDSARWMHSGDLATMDDEGYVSIVGRIKDLIIRGGENIYPRELEEFLFSHPEIAEAHVIGVPCKVYGEQVMAWVKPKSGAELDPEDVRDFCRGKISHFKVPKYVKIVDSFPMTVTGKVQKYVMRRIALEELEAAGVE